MKIDDLHNARLMRARAFLIRTPRAMYLPVLLTCAECGREFHVRVRVQPGETPVTDRVFCDVCETKASPQDEAIYARWREQAKRLGGKVRRARLIAG